MNEQEINAAVAEKVAGAYCAVPHKNCATVYWTAEHEYNYESEICPDYLHDANAVIALLERSPYDIHATFVQTCCTWYVTLMERFIGKKEWTAEGDTFCRAACLALLQAHGAPAASEKDAK